MELLENESSTVLVRLRQSDERFEHLRQVLKKTNKGDEFKATILNERLATGRILSYDDDERSVLIEILSTKEEEEKEEKMVTVSLLLADAAAESIATITLRFRTVRGKKRVYIQRGEDGAVLFPERGVDGGRFGSRVYSRRRAKRLGFQISKREQVQEFERGIEALLSSGDEEGRAERGKISRKE